MREGAFEVLETGVSLHRKVPVKTSRGRQCRANADLPSCHLYSHWSLRHAWNHYRPRLSVGLCVYVAYVPGLFLECEMSDTRLPLKMEDVIADINYTHDHIMFESQQPDFKVTRKKYINQL